MMNNAVYFMFPFLRYKILVLVFFVLMGKRLDKETKANLKNYDFTTWGANNYNTHFLPNMLRSLANEIW